MVHPGSSSTSPHVTLKRLPYSIDNDCPIPWPSSFDSTINEDYPFPLNADKSIEEYIIKCYLETLWLPESVIPLIHFVKTLRRLSCSPTHPHASHEALKILLRTPQSMHDKYHQQLPRILEDEGGTGEIEESMMWYAYSIEKYEGKETQDIEAEKSWTKSWMVKMEHRETMMQILLYMHILSLPLPPPCTPKPSPGKRKDRRVRGLPTSVKELFPPISSIEAQMNNIIASTFASATTAPSIDVFDHTALEERLEVFMDKLSVWQMMAAINSNNVESMAATQQHDWMQVFCEDVVSPLFKDRRPDLYNLLRTKVFPHSPFSDDSDTSVAPPPIRAPKKGGAEGRRPSSPLRLEELEKPKKNSRHKSTSFSQTDTNLESNNKASDAPQRCRSRSRSVSVAAEEVRARGASRGGVASSKTLFRGEIEMKRTSSRGSKLFAFSTTERPSREQQQQQQARVVSQNTTATTQISHQPFPLPQTRRPQTLVIDTPVKKVPMAKEEDSPGALMSPDQSSLTPRFQWSPVGGEEAGHLLVKDTPIKKRL